MTTRWFSMMMAVHGGGAWGGSQMVEVDDATRYKRIRLCISECDRKEGGIDAFIGINGRFLMRRQALP